VCRSAGRVLSSVRLRSSEIGPAVTVGVEVATADGPSGLIVPAAAVPGGVGAVVGCGADWQAQTTRKVAARAAQKPRPFTLR
jgi:hypothetical protein